MYHSVYNIRVEVNMVYIMVNIHTYNIPLYDFTEKHGFIVRLINACDDFLFL